MQPAHCSQQTRQHGASAMLRAGARSPCARQTSLQRRPALPLQRCPAARRPLITTATAAAPTGGGAAAEGADGGKQSAALTPVSGWRCLT